MANENSSGRVELILPRARTGEDPALFVGLNGVNYLIPKGQSALVPPAVAAEIDRARAAEAHMYDASDAMKSEQ